MADSRDGEIGWYSPDPRAIIPLDEFRCPRNTRRLQRSNVFRVTSDRAFVEVIAECARRDETWISLEVERVYRRLHELGFAHSIECWDDDGLAGGLYGVALGGAFFGESMFHHKSGASDVALTHLVQHLVECGFTLLDIQFINSHLKRYGALEIPRSSFEAMLGRALFSGAHWLPLTMTGTAEDS
jgi:leucyl/phenylalanyl-tRNA---protein transferase